MAKPKLNIEQIKQLAAIDCSYAEMSAVLGCDPSTLTKSKAYSQAIQAGRGQGNVSLRRKQWDVAMQGSARMLEWLGKQRLGQRDKQDIKHEGVEMINVTTTSGEKTSIGIKVKE